MAGSVLHQALRAEELADALATCLGSNGLRSFGTASRDLEDIVRAAAVKQGLLGRWVFVCGGTSPPSLSSIERFDTVAWRWESLQPLSARRYGHAAVVLEGQLYICGGEPGPRDVMRYNSESSSWDSLPLMPMQRYDFAAAAVRGLLYVCGGAGNPKGSGHPLNSADRYDPGSGHWERLPPMSAGRVGAGAAALLGSFFVCGGADKVGHEMKTGERFDPITGAWRQLPLMSAGRAWHAAVASARSQAFFACGGKTHGRPTGALERLQAGARKWETLQAMGARRSSLALTVVGRHIYACGGDAGGGRASNDAERFDLMKQRWETLPSLLVARARAAAVAVPPEVCEPKPRSEAGSPWPEGEHAALAAAPACVDLT